MPKSRTSTPGACGSSSIVSSRSILPSAVRRSTQIEAMSPMHLAAYVETQ
ncbi:hypothetical protein NKI44_18985 [Mesorhizobium sp. M0614]